MMIQRLPKGHEVFYINLFTVVSCIFPINSINFLAFSIVMKPMMKVFSVEPTVNFKVCILLALTVLAEFTMASETSLTPRDFANIGKFKERPTGMVDPETPGLFEGDMELSQKLTEYLDSQNISPDEGAISNAAKAPNLKWPNAFIPYSMSSDFNEYERSRIANAIKAIQSKTCIKIRPRTSGQSDYVYIYKGRGCSSMVGRVGGQQKLSLGNGCVTTGVIIHEFMHAAGFFHEQSRNDRDDYVNIKKANIKPDKLSNFRKHDLTTITHLGTRYDYGSVMHYSRKAFSRNNKDTIVPIQSGVQIGQREGLSQIDILKLRKLYGCTKGGGAKITGPRKPKTITKPKNKKRRCVNSERNCAQKKKINNCFPFWMKTQCRRACGLCGKPRQPGPIGPFNKRKGCKNFLGNNMCKQMAREGHCNFNSNFMQNSCCAACK